jgi:hypothetical protein
VFSVSAAEDRVKANGDKIREESVFVTAFSLFFTAPGAFTIEVVGSGFSTDADVKINGNLRHASASVDDLQVDGLVLDLDVTWTGVGDLSRFKSRSTFEDNGTVFRFSDDSRFRAAEVTALVNGTPVAEFSLVGASLSRSKSVSVCHGEGC